MNNLTELTNKIMELPLPDRILLAQALWESIGDADAPASYSETELREELQQRLRDQPDETWKTHEQVMEEARRKAQWPK